MIGMLRDRLGSHRRRRLTDALPPLVAVIVVVIIALLTPAAAQAATLQLSVTPNGYPYGSSAPSGEDFLINVSGTYDQTPSQIDVYIHSASAGGTAGCPATDSAEASQVQAQMQQDNNIATQLVNAEPFNPGSPSGSYAQGGHWGVDAPKGTYWACAYLLQASSQYGQPADPPVATGAVQITQPGPELNGGQGGSSSGSHEACVVPHLIGKKLAAAKRDLAAAHCRAGKISHRKTRRAHRGHVVAQSKPAGAHLLNGAPVNLVVGR